VNKAIRVRGARTHNLKNVDVDIPRDKLTVITGLSGSGKSSLAFDTIYAEGQRRYVESLSAYARQFLSVMEKPDVDLIEGLSPAISIEQKTASHNPRSTVGTITEIYDYLRLLFARVGEPRCANHGTPLEAQTISQMVDLTLALGDETRIMLLAPVVRGRKGTHARLLKELHAQGYLRARINGDIVELDDPPELAKNLRHDIDAVIDRVIVRPDNAQRLSESFETTIALADGTALVALIGADDSDDAPPTDLVFSSRFACRECGYSIQELEPRLFSFNNPTGACPACDGIGQQVFFDPDLIVRDASLNIGAGAIPGWDTNNPYYFGLLKTVAAHYEVDLETPFGDTDERFKQTILYGSDDESIEFRHERPDGSVTKKSRPFEGVVRNMERRYRDTDSGAVREDLSRYIGTSRCKECGGARLGEGARHVFIADHAIQNLTGMPIDQLHEFFSDLSLSGSRAAIAEKIVIEIRNRVGFLNDVGLSYLSLDRTADTLSGGESQRIRLASQIGSGLVGVTYILDEPSIGLHQRDNHRLLETLYRLRGLGNTVIVVEHDEETMRNADHILDIGPGAGIAGGEVVASGNAEEIAANDASMTGRYLAGIDQIEVPEKRHARQPDRQIEIIGATGNNLKNVDVAIPLGLMTCVTGVSGSGKSTLINGTLVPALKRKINRSRAEGDECKTINGIEHVDKVVDIDQSAIGRTPRSNPATYTGLFSPLRDLFASTPEARMRGYKPGRFSFNVKGGRCEACQGEGLVRVEMHFLADVFVPCDICKGARYSRETLEIRYRGLDIREVLDLTIDEAAEFFTAIPVLARKLQTLQQVGLGYIQLGQSATTLSGGEAQRIKLARELSKRQTGRTVYILDEPTTGLHFHDVRQLLDVLASLRKSGNTIIVIEHNLDVIKTADWIIDLGPEGGNRGGEILVCGSPETVAENSASDTGKYLKTLLSGRQSCTKPGQSERAGNSP